ncbi:MAG: 4Fe-4S binding protein [Chloroflexi bacterium]|nr:MAG: 4Fe-4S binding protein [Chloroflexota bacterium]MBL1195452.1 4Fe-4S binding protein [Chloroflexota bacterium]
MIKRKSREPKYPLSKTRKWMQSSFLLLAFLIGLRHILPGRSSRGGGFDPFCPFGGIETLWSYLTTGETLQTTNLLNFTVLISVLGVSLIAGRAFCGWMCPLGTTQEYLARLAERISGSKRKIRGKRSPALLPIRVPPKVDAWLKYLKYGVLALILFTSITALYPPLHSICPARAFFAFDLSTPLIWSVMIGFIITSMLVERFSCKYLCPLGAVLAISNKISPIHMAIDHTHCVACGRGDAECPMDIQDIPHNTRHSECIRCFECLETCAKPGAASLRVG